IDFRNPMPTDSLKLGTHFLSPGMHKIRFACYGKADSATAFWCGLDHLLLEPLSKWPLSPGTFTQKVESGKEQSGSLHIYPNPSISKTVHVSARFDRLLITSDREQVNLEFYDVLGRRIAS